MVLFRNAPPDSICTELVTYMIYEADFSYEKNHAYSRITYSNIDKVLPDSLLISVNELYSEYQRRIDFQKALKVEYNRRASYLVDNGIFLSYGQIFENKSIEEHIKQRFTRAFNDPKLVSLINEAEITNRYSRSKFITLSKKVENVKGAIKRYYERTYGEVLSSK